jgi:hypothetical protein
MSQDSIPIALSFNQHLALAHPHHIYYQPFPTLQPLTHHYHHYQLEILYSCALLLLLILFQLLMYQETMQGFVAFYRTR